MKFNWASTLIAAICVLLLLPTTAVAGEGSERRWHNPEGTWRQLDTSNGFGGSGTITRRGPGTYDMVIYSADPVPDGVHSDTPFVGVLERSGRADFQFTVVRYRRAADGAILFTVVLIGTAEMTDGGTMVLNHFAAAYLPWQDPWTGEPPALGYFGPYSGTQKRIAQLPLHEP